jgi:hypothetical protein
MNITLYLTVEEVNVIIQGLGELPAKTSMALIQKIQDEGSKQLQPNNYTQNGNQTYTEDIPSVS